MHTKPENTRRVGQTDWLCLRELALLQSDWKGERQYGDTAELQPVITAVPGADPHDSLLIGGEERGGAKRVRRPAAKPQSMFTRDLLLSAPLLRPTFYLYTAYMLSAGAGASSTEQGHGGVGVSQKFTQQRQW